jgi:hypothetical protein
MKISLLLAFIFSVTAFGHEVPKELNDLLQGQKEKIYIGKTEGQEEPCEIRVFENDYGFYIDAYERNENGDIDINDKFGRFIISEFDELYDFWSDNFGLEAVSVHFSPVGSSFDRKAIITIEEYWGGEKLLNFTYKKNNGMFFYTIYELACVLSL